MVCVYFLEYFRTKLSVHMSLALKLEMPSKKLHLLQSLVWCLSTNAGSLWWYVITRFGHNMEHAITCSSFFGTWNCLPSEGSKAGKPVFSFYSSIIVTWVLLLLLLLQYGATTKYIFKPSNISLNPLAAIPERMPYLNECHTFSLFWMG